MMERNRYALHVIVGEKIDGIEEYFWPFSLDILEATIWLLIKELIRLMSSQVEVWNW